MTYDDFNSEQQRNLGSLFVLNFLLQTMSVHAENCRGYSLSLSQFFYEVVINDCDGRNVVAKSVLYIYPRPGIQINFLLHGSISR